MADKHDIMWFDSLDSTNNEAKRRISDIDNLSVLSAVSQTAGRGQKGNTWHAEPGENLTFSIVLKFGDKCFPELRAEDSFMISEITAISVVQLLEKYDLDAMIKWPNDIYIGDEKVCGILIENSLCSNGVKSSIIGIGLNINQKNFDVNLPNPTSLLLQKCKQNCFSNCVSDDCENISKYDIKLVLDEFLSVFSDNCSKYLNEYHSRSELKEKYVSKLWRLGCETRFIDFTVLPAGHSNLPVVTGIKNDSGFEFAGIIRGISPIGNLLIETPDENIKEFGFKEVSYIL